MNDRTIGEIRATASCLCGGIAFEIRGPLRQIIHCHCGQCRKTHGLMGPYTKAHWDDLAFSSDATLKWYASSDHAARGFCSECGASIFWRPQKEDGALGEMASISAGAIDPPTRLEVIGHIYTRDKADFCDLPDDGLPRFETTSAGKLDGDLST